jgi:tRNA(adenine34) deaminase
MGMSDEHWMREALKLAKNAGASGEVPVGAIVVLNDSMVGSGFNQPIQTQDPTHHAEVMAIRQACAKLNNYRLAGCELFVTVEPCMMCAGACVHARISRLVFGATEPKAGAVISQSQALAAPHLNHKVATLGGVLEQQCSALMTEFFDSRRREKKHG